MTDSSTNSSNGLKIGLGIAVLLLLGTLFYTFKLHNESKITQQELTDEKTT